MSNIDFKTLLNNRDLKATSPRLNLLELMQDYQTAMPYNAIQKAMQPIDRVTLYRTLETLTEQGIIHKAYQEQNEVYYAVCGNQCTKHFHDHKHIHFKCEKCNTVTCENLEQALIPTIPEYQIKKVSIIATGICKACR